MGGGGYFDITVPTFQIVGGTRPSPASGISTHVSDHNKTIICGIIRWDTGTAVIPNALEVQILFYVPMEAPPPKKKKKKRRRKEVNEATADDHYFSANFV